jgi:hypothetical protein
MQYSKEIEYETRMKDNLSSDPTRNLGLNLQRTTSALNLTQPHKNLTGLTGTLAFCDLTFEPSLCSLEVRVALKQKALEDINRLLLHTGTHYCNGQGHKFKL